MKWPLRLQNKKQPYGVQDADWTSLSGCRPNRVQAAVTSKLTHEITTFLAAHHVLSLATLCSSAPYAVNLFYACDGLALLWLSDPETKHSRALEINNQVAATVAPDYSEFAIIKGVQIIGTARRIMDEERRSQYLTLLEARYLFLAQLSKGPQELRRAYSRTAVYRLEPVRIVLIDNAKGFGHKDVLEC